MVSIHNDDAARHAPHTHENPTSTTRYRHDVQLGMDWWWARGSGVSFKPLYNTNYY